MDSLYIPKGRCVRAEAWARYGFPIVLQVVVRNIGLKYFFQAPWNSTYFPLRLSYTIPSPEYYWPIKDDVYATTKDFAHACAKFPDYWILNRIYGNMQDSVSHIPNRILQRVYRQEPEWVLTRRRLCFLPAALLLRFGDQHSNKS